jgi:primosomal protein N' (replication factor Y) (superfamily II helicase)
VLVDVPLFHLDRPFTYRVPEALRGHVHLGSRVKVPFGGRRRVDGWVVGRAPELPPDARDLIRVVSPIPSFGPPELDLLRWVATRYAATVTDTLRLAIPPRVAAVEASFDPPDPVAEASVQAPGAPHPNPPGALHPNPPGAAHPNPPGALHPNPPDRGAPAREGSPGPGSVRGAVHSPGADGLDLPVLVLDAEADSEAAVAAVERLLAGLGGGPGWAGIAPDAPPR